MRSTDDGVEFFVDGRHVHQVGQSPGYPCQLMIGVFDSPARRPRGDEAFVPELVASRVSGQPITT